METQKHRFLTQRQALISIAVVAPRRKITIADHEAAQRLSALWTAYKERTQETQEQAGAKIGLTQAAFSQYVHGNIALNLKMTLKFARLFGVRPTAIRPEDELLRDLDFDSTPPDAARLAGVITHLPVIMRNNLLEYAIFDAGRSDSPLTEEQRAEYIATLRSLKASPKRPTRR